jgi:predicted ribosome quality control (RQC) complex YloA/Tae2 family protein
MQGSLDKIHAANVPNRYMSLKWKELELQISEARPFLEGGVLQKIAQCKDLGGGESFLLQGYGGALGSFRLWISLFQDKTCMALLPPDQKPDTAKEATTFVMVLRKHLLGRKILKIEQLAHDRMAVIHFDEAKSLLVVLIPRRGNLALLENWDEPARQAKSIGSYQKISLKTGALYELPAAPQKLPVADVRPELAPIIPNTKLSFNYAVAKLYQDSLEENQFQTRKRQWQQAFKSYFKKVKNALEHVTRDLEQAREAELFQMRGKALFAQLYELGAQKMPKEKSITLDFVEGDTTQVLEIPLDKSKTFADNAEYCFKKAKKFTRAVGELVQMQGELAEKIAGLEVLGAGVTAAETEEALENLSEQSARWGLEIAPVLDPSKAPKSSEAKPFLEVLSVDGFTILCGRNQEENRRVTFQESRGNDLWLHLKGAPGAHVVILAQKNKTVPLSTLLEAAQITLYHSKIRDGRKAEVDYTMRKYVRAIKGTIAEVTYTENKALNIEASGEQYRKIITRQI